ncbi:MAG: alpha/beta hydrolase [Candidatus Zipacnadales bacterium]
MKRVCRLSLMLLGLLTVGIVVPQVILPSADLFQRDANQPLNAEIEQVEDTVDWTVYHVVYDSTNGQRVPALLGIPKVGEGPFPLMIVQHGLGGSKEVNYVQMLSLGLAKAGYATLRIDAHSHGERGALPTGGNSLQVAMQMVQTGGWVQSIVDMRRAIDFAETQEQVDADRIGYLGISMGAIMGGVLCGVDERIDVAILVLGGSFSGIMPGLWAHIDPASYIANFAPRPLLMLNGKNDPLIPPAAAQALYDAAQEPKRIVWYETGHMVPPIEAIQEVAAFLSEHLPVATPAQ